MSDPTAPGPTPYKPLLRPGGRCFHCGAALTTGGPCPGCGQDSLLTREQEAGRIAYLLHALGQAVTAGLLPRDIEPRLTAPFREVLEPGVHLPARPASAPRPAAPPRKPVSFAVLWANALLYLGAFFIVIAAIVFLFAMGGLGRTVLAAMLAALFLGTGLVCRSIEMVRSAGNIFTGTGALVVPLVFVALANYLSGRGPLSSEQIWLAASAACTMLYVAFAAFGLGRFYAVLALLAASSAWQALFDVAGLGWHWLPAWFAAQALCLCGLHHAAKNVLGRSFGPLVLVWGLLWALPSLVGLAIVSFDDAHPAASVLALVLLIGLSALTAWRLGDVVSPLCLGVLVLALVPATLRLLDAPGWVSGVAIIPVTWAYVAYWWWRRGTAVAGEFLVLGCLAAFCVAFLPVYTTAPAAGLFVGLGASAVLALAAAFGRVPPLLVAPGATLAALWWHLLHLLPFKDTSAVGLGLGYLPVVVLLSVLALALPLGWSPGWRRSLAAIAGAYAVVVVCLTFESNRALALTLGLLTLLGSSMVARWRSPWLLAVPGFTAMALILTSLRLLDVRPEAAGPSVLVLAFAASAAGIALRAGSRVPAGGFSLAWRLLGLALSACAFAVAVHAEVTGTAGWATHVSGLCLAAIAGLIAVEGVWLRTLLYPASAVLMAAVLWEINAFGFENLQCFAVPLGLYLMLLAIVVARDPLLEKSRGPLSALAWVASALVFGLATFIQSLGSHPIRYAVILLVESLVLLGLGLVVRRRALLAASTTLLVLGGLRLLFLTPALILPALILAGLLLLVVGFVVLVVVGLRQRKAKDGEPAE
jgi:hypothetical protein